MWRPDNDFEDPVNELIQPVCQAQSYEINASSRPPADDTPDVVECMFMSKISYPLRPPLINSSMAIDTCSTLSACLAVEDITLYGLPYEYHIRSMRHARDSRYMINVRDWDSTKYGMYAVDIDTREINHIGMHGDSCKIVTRDDIVVVFKHNGNAIVLDGHIDAGQIDLECKFHNASGHWVSDRYCQDLNDNIYVVDRYHNLWRISWHDVKARRYDAKCVFSKSVEDFYMHEHGNAILKTTGIIALSGGQSINMQDVAGSVRWSTVTRAANRWIVSGGENNDVCEGYCDKYYDSTSTIASVDDRGVGISSMSIRTTAVAYSAFIKYLKTAIVRGDRAIILAIEVSACCHLISMTASGRLHLIESMPSIRRPDVMYPGDGWKIIESMTESDVEGQYIVAGYTWIRKLTVRLN